MENGSRMKTIRSIVREIGFEGCSLLSINDLTNDQIYGCSGWRKPWSRGIAR